MSAAAIILCGGLLLAAVAAAQCARADRRAAERARDDAMSFAEFARRQFDADVAKRAEASEIYRNAEAIREEACG